MQRTHITHGHGVRIWIVFSIVTSILHYIKIKIELNIWNCLLAFEMNETN